MDPLNKFKDDSLLQTGGNIFSYPARVVVMILLFLHFAQNDIFDKWRRSQTSFSSILYLVGR